MHLRTLFCTVLILLREFPALGAGMKEMNPPAEPSTGKTIALIGGRLIDGNGGRPVDNAVVVIEGSKILIAGSTEDISIPERAERIQVKGYAILPGLIDTHFHSKNDLVRPITYELEKGITSFRDPGHPFKYYDNVLASHLTLPRIFLCGGHLDGSPAVHPDQAVLPQNASDTRHAVHAHIDRGASAIKVYFRLPLDLISAACEAAKERGVLVTAHLELVDADAAIRAGVRGIEHVTSFGTVLADSKDAAYFKAEILADSNTRRVLRPWLWSRVNLERSPNLKPLLDLMVETGTFVSPTAAIFEARRGKNDATPIQVRAFENMLRFLSMCHEAGVKMVVGSHTRAPLADIGYAFQREMELWVEAGMSPLEVLTAATKTGADFLGMEDRLGTIEKGKTADVILVEGDPSSDIKEMRNVRHVLQNGSWVVGGLF